MSKYLGCDHCPFQCSLAQVDQETLSLLTLPPKGGGPTPALSQGGPDVAAEPDAFDKARKTVREAGGAVVNAVQWDMSDFLKQCVGLYQELGGASAKTLRKADTPFLELPLSERAPAEGVSGELAPIASKVLMKILYAARMARYDLLRATCYLATRITKWDASCDSASPFGVLHQLVARPAHDRLGR